METLKPVKIHAIIGTSTVWSDELWGQALSYLRESTGTFDVLAMAETLYGDNLPNYPHKIDFLREFRDFPPTTSLGAFDRMRVLKFGSHDAHPLARPKHTR